MASKHLNRLNGRTYELSKDQRAEAAELQCSIMKRREVRRQQFEQESLAEIKELDGMATRFAAELSIDVKKYTLNLDSYRFEPKGK